MFLIEPSRVEIHCTMNMELLQHQSFELKSVLSVQYHDADTLLDGFENNTKRFVKVLCEAADDAMPVPDRQDLEEDIYDILYNQVRCYLALFIGHLYS